MERIIEPISIAEQLLYSTVRICGDESNKKSKAYSIGSKIILLGLLFGGPVYTSEGKIEIKEIPAKQIPITKSQQWIHLGFYVKAKEILTLCEYIKQRKIDK